MEQPPTWEQLSSTQRPPRLHTALHVGFRQQDSQQVAPPLPEARGRQPRPMTLVQWIPNTPPVTLQISPDTHAGMRGEREHNVNLLEEALKRLPFIIP